MLVYYGVFTYYIVKLHQKSSHMAYMSASGWPPSSPPTSPPSLLKTSTPTTKIKRWTKTFHGIQTKDPDVSDLHRYQQGEGHLQVLRRGLDVVPVPLLAGAARGHPRASPPPVLPHHHRHHPHQLPHDDPHTLGTDRIYRVSILTAHDLRRMLLTWSI